MIIKKKISLFESLVGFNFKIKHLDNRELLVNIDTIIKPDTMKVVKYEGMYIKNNQYRKGHLYISFEVEFPNDINSKVRKLLQEEYKIKTDYPDNETPVELDNPENINNYDDDDEYDEPNGQQHVQCAQQ